MHFFRDLSHTYFQFVIRLQEVLVNRTEAGDLALIEFGRLRKLQEYGCIRKQTRRHFVPEEAAKGVIINTPDGNTKILDENFKISRETFSNTLGVSSVEMQVNSLEDPRIAPAKPSTALENLI